MGRILTPKRPFTLMEMMGVGGDSGVVWGVIVLENPLALGVEINVDIVVFLNLGCGVEPSVSDEAGAIHKNQSDPKTLLMLH
jgi:hypothetical protein